MDGRYTCVFDCCECGGQLGRLLQVCCLPLVEVMVKSKLADLYVDDGAPSLALSRAPSFGCAEWCGLQFLHALFR